jgi:argininosuccinate lyase
VTPSDYSQSVSFDRRLAEQDIATSLTHAAALLFANIITQEEYQEIESGLLQIRFEIQSGTFHWDTELEDVHMNIEAALTFITPAGKKLHTGRSRNDQVATDLRLYVQKEIGAVMKLLRSVQTALLELAGKHNGLRMPGYTHLQRAQPILFSTYLRAQDDAFDRDQDRLISCLFRADTCPLGAGALAGNSFGLNKKMIARALGFGCPTPNTVDAVSDRDFVCEFLFCLAMIGMHLSRVCEDLVIWSTTEFGFVTFSDNFSTGSSMMPQKRNPDYAELTRGKTGRLYGNLMAILTVMKGLPHAYNRDMQEDKEPLFDSVDTVKGALEIFAAMLNGITVDENKIKNAARDPALFATRFTEYLVTTGVPFREAHAIVRKLTQ